MPRDLFGNVTRPSISLGNRKWYTVPVSLLSHAIVLATIVIVPILAAPMMPGVVDGGGLERFITIMTPTPPPAPKPRTERPQPIPSDGPPIDTPNGFAPEKPKIEAGWEDDKPTGTFIADIDPGVIVAPPPPKPDVKPQAVRPGFQGVRTPVKTYNVDPVYPSMAQQVRLQGIVIIEATIGVDGRVTNARILRSIPLLDQAALDAVRQWQYTPTMLNGTPVPVIMTVTVNFMLK